MPQYIQRSRKPGARLPPNTRVCTRGTKWENPFRVNAERTAEHAVAEYDCWLTHHADLELYNITELAQYDYLACWCRPGGPCHVQNVLIPLVQKYKTWLSTCPDCGKPRDTGNHVACIPF